MSAVLVTKAVIFLMGLGIGGRKKARTMGFSQRQARPGVRTLFFFLRGDLELYFVEVGGRRPERPAKECDADVLIGRAIGPLNNWDRDSRVEGDVIRQNDLPSIRIAAGEAPERVNVATRLPVDPHTSDHRDRGRIVGRVMPVPEPPFVVSANSKVERRVGLRERSENGLFKVVDVLLKRFRYFQIVDEYKCENIFYSSLFFQDSQRL